MTPHTPHADARKTMVVAAVALVVSLLLLHRWLVTPLGMQSFGRVWHLNVNYFEFGFMRRTFEGTLVYLSGLRHLFGVYETAYVWQSLKLVVLCVLLYASVQSRLRTGYRLFKAALFLSPALLWHLAYSAGNPDLLVMIIAAASLLLPLQRPLLVLLLVAGVLTHESFAFLLPGIVLVYELRRDPGALPGQILVRAAAIAIPVLLLYSALYFFTAQHAPDRAVFETRMAERLGPAAYKHGYWSGYSELFSRPDYGIQATEADLRALPRNLHFVALPALYAVVLAGLVFFVASRRSRVVASLLALAMLFPFAICYLANDFYRWISFSAGLSLLCLCHLLGDAQEQGRPRSRLEFAFALLLPLSLLGPFGSNPLDEPFPAARFAWERLGHR